jgi:hypothetical protein
MGGQGMHLCLENGMDVLVRIARCDVNSPRGLGRHADEIFEMVQQQVSEVQFEAEIYQLLRPHRGILTPSLLYWRAPAYEPSALRSNRSPPRDILGRAFFVFEKTQGVNNVWPDNIEKRVCVVFYN